jgi:hypothetical protein
MLGEVGRHRHEAGHAGGDTVPAAPLAMTGGTVALIHLLPDSQVVGAEWQGALPLEPLLRGLAAVIAMGVVAVAMGMVAMVVGRGRRMGVVAMVVDRGRCVGVIAVVMGWRMGMVAMVVGRGR